MTLAVQPYESIQNSAIPHHNDEVCPTCEQTIPNDRLEQVKARQAQHQREVDSQYALKLRAEREQLVVQLQQKNEEALAKVRQEEAETRAQERRTTMAEAQAMVSAAALAADTARTQTDELKKQLEASHAAAAEKVTAARAEERRAATAEAEAKAAVANTTLETVRAQADDLKKQLEAIDAAMNEKVAAARDEARKEVEVALQPQLAAAQLATHQAQEQARLLSEREQAAIVAKAAAEHQVQALRDAQEQILRDSIQETREALEKSNREALNAEQAKNFEEKQKIQNTVEDLKRQLENKTALELGEGAEIDLFEALKEAFPDDDINRIKRGVAGADIRQMVRHNGKGCGLILYDSKNHKAWRSDFIAKLRDDQIADKADHAILATIAFPQGTRQIHIQDGVILVNPARAVVIAELVRRQILQAHCLNMSNDDREQKSLELYSFIMSERFGALMTKLHATTDSLNDLESKEQAAHKAVWQRRGQLIGSVAKAEADLRFEIDRIVGTADTAPEEALASMTSDATANGA